MARKIKHIALDTETTGVDLLKGCRAFALSLCDERERQWFWDWPINPLTRQPIYTSKEYKKCLAEVPKVLKNYDTVVYHNAKFDRRAVRLSPGLEGILDLPWEDTLLLSHVMCSSGSHNLKDLCVQLMEIEDEDEKELHDLVNRSRAIARSKHKDWKLGPDFGWDFWLPKALNPKDRTCEKYCRKDTYRTMALWLGYCSVATDEDWESYRSNTARGVMQPTSDMEERGVTLNVRRLKSEIRRYSAEVLLAEQTCRKLAGDKELNLNSPKQLVELLFQKWKLRPTHLTGGGQNSDPSPSTSATAIRTILSRDPKQMFAPGRKGPGHTKALKDAPKFLASLLLQRTNSRAMSRLESDRARMVPDPEHPDRVARIYFSFNQTGTVTTRFSADGSQNISKGKELIDEEGNEYVDFSIRNVYGPAPGRLWYAFDYNQLQLRIFAYASEEQSIIDAFDAGWDFHSFVASRIFNVDKPTKIQRRTAKNLNFCLIFGGSPAKADLTAGMPGAYRLFRNQFPSIDRYMQSTINFVRKHGFVRTLGGYKLIVPADKPYVGTNYVIQGTEGEIVKDAMVTASRYCDRRLVSSFTEAFMTLQVHDELVFDFKHDDLSYHKPYLRDIKGLMEKAGQRVGVKTPVDCERITRDYAHGKKVRL